jgi:predicted Zn finger-like uncharacterized protein
MIAACPKCAARYRIERERLAPEGVRLRCARCQAVFRVRRPDAPAGRTAPAPSAPAPEAAPAARGRARPAELEPQRRPAPPRAPEPEPRPAQGELVLVGMPDPELAKRLEASLRRCGLATVSVSDGVEAILEVQRKLPRAAVLSAALPRMYGFQICELMKRNQSLRAIGVVLVGSVHHPDRYRRPPGDLYGADAYVEEPDLPEALLPVLQRMGLQVRAPRPVAMARPAAPPPPAGRPQAPARPAPAARADDGLGEMRAKAERLARIIVSDIVLYNEEKFVSAVRAGSVLEAMAGDLDEGRALFRERIDERVRAEKDHLAEELLRVARERRS